MTKAILCCLVIFAMQNLTAQNNSREAFPNGGGTVETTTNAVSFSIGQSVVQTLEGESISLTQGFQQADLKGTVGTINFVEQGEYHIYPNPTTGDFMLDIHSSETISGRIEIVNNLGQKVHAQRLDEFENTSLSFSYPNLNDGVYHVLLISKAGQILFNQKLLLTK